MVNFPKFSHSDIRLVCVTLVSKGPVVEATTVGRWSNGHHGTVVIVFVFVVVAVVVAAVVVVVHVIVIVVIVGVVGVKRPSVGRWSIGHQTIPTGCVTSHNWPDVSHFQNRSFLIAFPWSECVC